MIQKRSKKATDYRKKEEQELKDIESRVKNLEQEVENKISNDEGEIPVWFYVSSIFAVLLFAGIMSVFATLQFEDIRFIKTTTIFLFVGLILYFIISAVYLFKKKSKFHVASPIAFILGVGIIILYSYYAVDTSQLLQYTIIYSVVVILVCVFIIFKKKYSYSKETLKNK